MPSTAAEPGWVNLAGLGSANVSKLVSGDRHGALLDTAGKIYTWGADAADGHYLGRPIAPQTQDGTPTSIDAGGYSGLASSYQSTIGLKTSKLYGWGYSRKGELGVVSSTPLLTPQSVFGSLSFSALLGGGCFHFGALDDSVPPNLVFWGDNTYGQRGSGLTQLIPNQPEVLVAQSFVAPLVEVSFGCMTTFVKDSTEGSNIIAFGRNDVGQVGVGSVAWVALGRPSLPAPVDKIASGVCHSLVVLDNANRDVYGWGCNHSSQLGRNLPFETENIYLRSPFKILLTFSDLVSDVAIIGNTSFFLTAPGDVWAVGALEHKVSAFPGQSLFTGDTSLIRKTILLSQLSPLTPPHYISKLLSVPYMEPGNPYVGFAEVLPVPPAPSPPPSEPPSQPPPSGPPPTSPSTSPFTAPSNPPSNPPPPPPPSTECPLPAPQPIAQFQCINGTWTAPGGLGGNGTVIIGTPVVVIGDWETEGPVVIQNPGGIPNNVTGCLFLNGSLEIEINPDLVQQDKSLPLFIASCYGPNTPLIGVKPSKDSCKKITAETQLDRRPDGSVTLNVIFKTDTFKCKVWWIVLASVLGGVALIAAIFLVIALSNQSCRRFFKPHSTRAEAPKGAGAVH
jgi:hypothetical protein